MSIVLIIPIIIFALALYLLIDFIREKANVNAFLDKWAKKTDWIWLPFYALYRLIREIFLDKR